MFEDTRAKWTHKDQEIYATGAGIFYTEMDDDRLEAPTLEALKAKIDKRLAQRVKRVAVLVENDHSWGEPVSEIIPATVTSCSGGNNFWVVKGTKYGEREKMSDREIFKVSAKPLLEEIIKLGQQKKDIDKRIEELQGQAHYSEEELKKEMNFIDEGDD